MSGRKAERQTYRPATCPVCRATIIVWIVAAVGERIARLLAVADHLKTLHPETVQP